MPPFPQLTHEPAPVKALYVPVTHSEHAWPLLPAVVPSMHSQSLTLSEADPLWVLTGHSVHPPDPVDALYLPGVQAEQPEPVYPASHWQAVAALPVGLLFAGHVRHEDCPVLGWYSSLEN